MLGNRPMSDWVAQYATSHQHPVNRLCHTFGIPLIVIAILMALAGFAWPSLWIPAAIWYLFARKAFAADSAIPSSASKA